MINHKANCTHPQTPKARKACRKAAKVVVSVSTRPVCAVGNGRMIHEAILDNQGVLVGAKCRAGQGSNVRRLPDISADRVVTCHRCR